MRKQSICLMSLVGLASAIVAPVGVILATRLPAIAQSDSCYMVTSSGRVVSLSKLCNSNNQVAPAKTKPAATGTGSTAANMFQAKIKYRLGKTPVIDVTFNGRQTFEMIVDTGADRTLITLAMARSMQLPVTGVQTFIMADGRAVELPISRVPSISVSGAAVRNVEVAIAEKTDIGLLGHDFFDNYDVKIKQNVVEFYKR